MRILLIDDDDFDRANARRALLRRIPASDIVECATASDGLAEFARHHYDAVLLDYRLPDAEGLDALHKLRSGPGTQCAVLILSGLDDEGLAVRCLEEGAQDYLFKDDLDPRHLYRALTQAQQRFRLEETLRRNNEEIRSLAQHDPLTGLANRRFFDESLRAAMPLAQRHGRPLALLLLDIDNFKYINDSYGHDAGDTLLAEVARRLQGTLRGGDMLCRLGGDEFAVLAHEFATAAQAHHLAQRLLAALERPIRVESVDVNCSVSIGVACYPSGASTADELMKHADLAMYRSKRAGRNRISFYSESLNVEAVRRVTLERELRAALASDAFEVYYQPQFHRRGDDIVAIESLLRWRHPTRGLLSPAEFLDIAEDSGLIVPIGSWVLHETCRRVRAWRSRPLANGYRPVACVNLSAAQLRNDALPGIVRAALAENDLEASDLEFEITENAIVEAHGRASEVLQSLAEMGASIALDDFGTGFSSLSHLRLFPIRVLKIDKSLLHGATTVDRDQRLLMSVLTMARSLELESVVEGVETKEQAELACRLGADRLQGFLLSNALTATDLDARLDLAAA